MSRVYDVIVIGAGPAGCAAARTLAKSNLSVGLLDKAVFPRDKVCGDALIPDAYHALKKLGLIERVIDISCPVRGMRLTGFDGSNVLVRAAGACVPRLKLDELLLKSAIEAGAEFLSGHEFARIADEDGKTYCVEFFNGNDSVIARSAWVLLATGAAIKPIQQAGLLLRAESRSVAVRQYVRNERLAKDFNELVFAFDRTVKGGYGWVFPGPDAIFNIGIGFFGSAHKHSNPRRAYEGFVAQLPLARDLIRDGTILSPLTGAPLRTGLAGARFAKGGLMGIGECIGATFPLTGEGIGKAMETGMLAASAIIAQSSSGRGAVAEAYTQGIAGLQPKYDVYRKAEFMFSWPYLTNKLVTHADNSLYIRTKVEGLFNETTDPAFLLTLSGWRQILFGSGNEVQNVRPKDRIS
ncbi:geranylgeranyl reductase family protein [Nitrosospira sp. Nsp2]|uniref:NAD(P)/FAD-dependent oxidoreductase n=1 Tax=Nitrosospira sp. Nsp2 TaxID=136548 RepID=UPI000D31E10E|nr:geranylgeranyl reductase family protein [Nitrosospira sp. Nsp2]PTR15268.1 geranylgeranyl reductase family protein [Nitrosospira sp. Nsp2]